MKRLLLTTAASMVAATAAFAGSPMPAPVDPAPMVPAVVAPMATDWGGFYVGAMGAYLFGDTDDLTVTPTATDTFDGYGGGLFAGYNFQTGSGVVLGAEVAGSFGNMTYATPPDLNVTLVDGKLRLGFAAGDALIYGAGGLSYAMYDNNDEGWGWNIGAGVDYMLTDNVFLGVAYTYRDITDSLNDPAQWEDKFSTIEARVGLRF